MPSPPSRPPDLTVGPASLVGEPPAFLTAEQLLAEPDRKSGEWVAGVVRRLVAATARPVAVGLLGDSYAHVRARLDAAGWFCAGEGADLEGARANSWPNSQAMRGIAGITGSIRPKLILVAQQQTAAAPHPLASRSGTWMWLALRMLGWDELTVCVTNARTALGKRRTKDMKQLQAATSGCDPIWLALGGIADEMLNACKIPHVHAWHPHYHQRARYSEDVSGYAKRLVEAGVPHGPWFSQLEEGCDRAPLPVCRVDELPELPEPYAIRSVAFRRGSGLETSGAKGSGLLPHHKTAAWQAYLTGIYRGEDGVVTPIRTIPEAAAAVGANRNRVDEIARAENWKGQREEHDREVAQAAIDAAKKQKATSQARAMQLAWKTTEVYLRKVLEDLVNRGDSPEVALNTQGVRHLVWAAIALGQQSLGDADGGPIGDTSPAAMMKKLEAVIAGHEGKAGAPQPLPE